MLRYLRFGLPALFALAVTVPVHADDKNKSSDKATCGDYGTSVTFEKTPSDAANKARKEEKLVCVLHISGHFEDPNLT